MSQEKIAELEQQIHQLSMELHQLRRHNEAGEVQNYEFETLSGKTTLKEMFGDKDRLLVIHNMGQACRYCTLWGDGINAFLPHLEAALSVVMVSKDKPQTQRRFANSRQWRFAMASHQGGPYIKEQGTSAEFENMPGAVAYERRAEKIVKLGGASFGPGDLYCSIWHLLALAQLSEEEWVPQYNYWKRPEQLDDGGEGLLD